ncbi:MAG: lamin tail domain-containing protein [Actinomycetota bacterium]|nr:lamin tail domain-containing protein [Actinomycetota bacterium]
MPARVGLVLVLLVLGALSAGCGGGGEETTVPPAATTPSATSPAAGEGTVGIGQAETIRDVPFSLNTEQPVPPDFREAYQRRALISVQFYKVGEDPFYPQGLEVDERVRSTMDRLRSQYPRVEFFSYDIDNPGAALSSEELEPGQYGTLAAQLGVGYTPFVAMLAPSGDQYVITNLFQGYMPRSVLNQALFDLSAIQVETNTSDLDVVLEQIELTETGGGIEYFTVQNRSRRPVNLQNFTVRVLDPETAEVNPDLPGVTINEAILLQPRQSVSIGRVPDVVDADGERVVGTFEGGGALELNPGDQVALLDSGGAVASTFTV